MSQPTKKTYTLKEATNIIKQKKIKHGDLVYDKSSPNVEGEFWGLNLSGNICLGYIKAQKDASEMPTLHVLINLDDIEKKPVDNHVAT